MIYSDNAVRKLMRAAYAHGRAEGRRRVREDEIEHVLRGVRERMALGTETPAPPASEVALMPGDKVAITIDGAVTHRTVESVSLDGDITFADVSASPVDKRVVAAASKGATSEVRIAEDSATLRISDIYDAEGTLISSTAEPIPSWGEACSTCLDRLANNVGYLHAACALSQERS